jgi:hypothetical protein
VGLKVLCSHVCLIIAASFCSGSGAGHADSRLLPWQQPPDASGRVFVDGRYGAEPPLLVPLPVPVPGAWMGGGGHLEPQFIPEPAAFDAEAPRDGAGAHFDPAAAAAPAFIDFLGVGAT